MNITFIESYSLHFLVLLAIGVVSILSQYLVKNHYLEVESGRKILHLVSILSCALVIHLTENRASLGIIFMIFFIILMVIAHKNVLIPSERKSYGIALFAFAFAVLLWSDLPLKSILFGAVVLAISDALAGWIGQKYAVRKIVFLSESKSWLGFTVFFISTAIIAIAFIGFSPVILIIALIPALSELFSYKGSDNLTIPIIAAFWFNQMLDFSLNVYDLIYIVLLIPVGLIILKKKWLDESGLAAAVLTGSTVYFATSVFFLIPLLLFFITGSITSKLNPKQSDAAKGRNAVQVFANGLIALIFLLLFAYSNNQIFLVAFIASVCVSFSDTLSSDIGTWLKQKTYDILSLRPITPGLSGGISVAGTLAGLAGALVFSVINTQLFDLNFKEGVIIAIAGFTGMLVDSIIGSQWQAKYINSDQKLSEENNASLLLSKGYSWMTNDTVNLVSNGLVVVILILIIK